MVKICIVGTYCKLMVVKTSPLAFVSITISATYLIVDIGYERSCTNIPLCSLHIAKHIQLVHFCLFVLDGSSKTQL